MLLPRHKTRHRKHRNDGAPKLRPGRPMKAPFELAPSRQDLKRRAQQLREEHMKQTEIIELGESPFERLPTEIIHHIFFDSLEINLANTSRGLNRILSDTTIYRALVLFAYFEDDANHPVETHHFRPAQYRILSCRERLNLQCHILKLRWCTLDRIMQCLPILSRLKMAQAWHRENQSSLQALQSMPGNASILPDAVKVPFAELEDIKILPALDEEASMENHFLAKITSGYYTRLHDQGQCVGPVGENDFLPFISTWKVTQVTADGRIHKTIHKNKSVFSVLAIPPQLLSARPWTEEKVGMLKLFRQAVRYKYSLPLQIARPSLFVGMESAIEERDYATLLLLVEFYTNEAFKEILASSRMPAALFHLATKQESAGASLLSLLIRADAEAIPQDDGVLTKWALMASADGDAHARTLGAWLLKFMSYDASRRAECSSMLRQGALSWRGRGLRMPFPEITFTRQIGYISERASNRMQVDFDKCEEPAGWDYDSDISTDSIVAL